jgi:gluconolactonase
MNKINLLKEILMRSFLFVLVLVSLAARSSAQDMPITQVLIPGEGWELLGGGYKFTEGPAVDKNGNVFFTDVSESKIFKLDTSNKIELFADKTAKTNGLMFGPDGLLYGCRNGDKQIVAYKPDGSFDVIASDVSSNDIAVSANGDIYFTDPPNKQVWFISADRKTKKVVASGFRPNGIVLWPCQSTVVVTDSDQPHLWTFRIEENGELAFPDKYYLPLQLKSGREHPGSDGMTVDQKSRLYVATHAGIQMFDPTGRLGGTILKPQRKFLSNVVFGGKDFNYMYATCSDKIYRRKVKPTGAHPK